MSGNQKVLIVDDELNARRVLSAILRADGYQVVESASVIVIPSGFKDAVAFAILLLILYFRPKGILGSPFIDSRRW